MALGNIHAVRDPKRADIVELPARSGRLMLFRVGALVFGLLLALAGLELAARIFLYRYGNFIDRLQEVIAHEYGGELTLRDIVRPARNPAQCYELVPGAWGRFARKPLRINSAGFRDRDHTKDKPSTATRLAVLGDSIAFGWGVDEEARFGNVLQDILERDLATSSSAIECLNFAVPGYNSVMECALLESSVWAYRPDVVIVNLVTNDDEVPNFVRLEPSMWAFDRSFLLIAIEDRLMGRPIGDTARLVVGGVVEAGGRGHGGRILGYRPELVPPQYRFLVGWDHMSEALHRMAAECRRRSTLSVCLLHYDIAALRAALAGNHAEADALMDPWRRAARDAGFDEIVDPLPRLVTYARNHGLTLENFIVSPKDIHPSVLAHRLMAEALAQHLLPRLRVAKP